MAKNTIFLKGDGIHKEGTANAAITPGDIVERMSTGKIRRCATAGAKVAVMFAIENEVIGKGIDTDYAANDNCYFVAPQPGSEFYGLVAAAAAAIVIGDYLESDGAGGLRKATTLTDNSGGTANTTLQDISASPAEAEIANNFADVAAAINNGRATAICVALEAVDNSGGGSRARIKVEVI